MKKYIEAYISCSNTEVLEAIATGKRGFKDLYELATIITLEDEDHGICRIVIEANIYWVGYLINIVISEKVAFKCLAKPTWVNDSESYEITINSKGLYFTDPKAITVIAQNLETAYSLQKNMKLVNKEINYN